MPPLAGHRAIHIQLPEGGIAQHLAEGGQGLQQDLLAVGDQQQRRRLGRGELLGEVGMEAGHVEGGEHGFAGAGGGHHEVAPALVERPLGRQGVEHLALVGVGRQGEQHRRGGGAGSRCGGRIHPPGQGELVIEAIALLGGGGIGLEFALFPVGLKGAFELAQHRGCFQGRQAHVPLQPIEQGGSREVGGADVGGAGATGAMKQPGLGMQTGAAGVGADAHLGTALHQPVERPAVCGAQVDSGEHPQGAAGREVLGEHGLQQPQPAPLDEGTEQINPISGGDFVDQRLHRRFAAGIHQQGAVGQGDQRSDGFGLAGQERRGSDLREQPGGGVQQVGRGDGPGCLALEQAHQLVHQGQLVLRGGATAQVLQGNAGQTRQVPGQQVRGFLGIKSVGGDQGFLQVAQLLLQALGEELLVEAGGGPG